MFPQRVGCRDCAVLKVKALRSESRFALKRRKELNKRVESLRVSTSGFDCLVFGRTRVIDNDQTEEAIL